MLRQGLLLLLAATVLAPAAIAGRHSPATTPSAPSDAAQRVVVRTELVRENNGFHWLDAAAGFGLAIVSLAAVLLVLPVHRWRPLRKEPIRRMR